MPFRSNVNDELILNSMTYCIAEHPPVPGWILETTKSQRHKVFFSSCVA